MARAKTLAGRAIEQHNSPNRGGRMSDCRGVVLHIAQGYYRGTISWQMNADQRYSDGTRVTTCSTWVVGRESGEWAQMVDSTEIAWTQQAGSATWLSIELAGWAPAAPSGWQVEACAQLLAWAHREHGVPLAVADHPGERGLGHHSMDREWLGEEWGHESCPGSGVIAAKAAIVKRAKEIEQGDDDMATPIENAKAFVEYRIPSRVSGDPVQVGHTLLAGTHAYAHRLATEVPGQLAAILAAVAGRDAVEAFRAELEAAAARERAERQAELAPLHAALEVAAAERAELRVLIGQVQSGEASAAAVVDEISRRLGPGQG